MGNSNSNSINALHQEPPAEIFQIKVANAGNSCYMDAVLFSMFAMPSPVLDAMLTKRQTAADHLAVQKQELQACILKQFVGRLRHCEHVTAESMANIRGMCRRVGWEYPGAPDMQQDAGEFFAFLYSCLGGQLIKTTRRTFTGALPDNSDRGHEENMALLPVPLCDSHPYRNEELNLASLVDTFFFENVAAGLRRKVQGHQQEVYALNTYSVENVPGVVAVSLKRFDEQLLKVETEVNFPSTLNLHKYSSRPEWRSSPIMQTVPWVLKSVVCHRGRSTQTGHYYAYTRYSKNDSASAVWLRLDDESTPCITQTNIWQDPYVKSEAVFFLYELDTDAHTAAMMMLQEEEEEMSVEGYGAFGFGFGEFGQGGFANGGTADAYEIPQSLPSFSNSIGGQSGGKESDAKETNQPQEPKNEDVKVPSPVNKNDVQDAPQEASADINAEAIVPVPAAAAHLPLSLADIEFLVTPNRGAPIVVNRKPCIQDRGETGENTDAKAQWEAQFEMCEVESLVCVSSLTHWKRSGSVKASILTIPDRLLVCSSLLSAQHPSAIFTLGCGDSAFVAVLEEE